MEQPLGNSSLLSSLDSNRIGDSVITNGDTPQADGLQVNIGSTGPRDHDNRVDELILAWVLLLHRGSLEQGENDFIWGCTTPPMGNSSQAEHITSSVSDIVGDGDESVSRKLEIVKRIRSTQNKGNMNPPNIVLTAGQKTNSNWTFSIAVKLVKDSLDLRISERPSSLSQRMAKCHLLALADLALSISLDEQTTISRVTEVGQNELAQICRWNHPMPPAIDQCIHSKIVVNAQRRPDRPAVYSWDGELTYGEVDRYSTQLSKHIVGLGVNVGDAVLLCFEKSMFTIVAVLAVMKAGGALVLTDPSQPEARLRTMATESNAHLMLTSRNQTSIGAQVAPDINRIAVDHELFAMDKLVPSSSLPEVPPSSTLYIIFTSGSTGKPKGVVISHSNYSSGAIPRAKAVGYHQDSRVLDFPSYAFDVSIDCMLCTLAQGGCICVPSEEARINNLSGAIRDMQVNMAHMTPSVARVLDPDILPSLEVLGLGGESVSASDATAWGRDTNIVIAYGPSECTVGCTINNDIVPGRTYTSIGKGVGGSTWIVDPSDDQRLMPVGAVGELLIEGPIVGVGYLNEPEKTASAFIENPGWLVSGGGDVPGRHGRLYKTGDLVRYDPDGSGSIVFVGRADQQVKLRGQRVELGEIEYHLRDNLPSGTAVASEVITPGGKAGEATLVAFIAEEKEKQLPNGTEKTVSFSSELTKALTKMDKALGTVLPRYMIPSAYIPLHEMPLLVSCKTDRKQLRAIGSSLSRQQLAKLKVTSAEKTSPQGKMEVGLCRLWENIFGKETDVGREDNFFDLGGDSLRAMRLVAAARSGGLTLTVENIFRFPTLKDMAPTCVDIDQKDDTYDTPEFSLLSPSWEPNDAKVDAAKLCNLNPSSVEDVYPCTPLQEGLMALSAKVSEAYVAQRVVKLPNTETARKLQKAFQAASGESSILRTRIIQVPRQGLMQVVVREEISWNTGDDLDAYLIRDRDQPMGLGNRLARFALVNDKESDGIHFVLTIHHALYDGWSMPLLVDRINKAYHDQKTEGRTPFKAFIKYLNSRDRQKSETYWRSQLDGAVGLQFPVLPWAGYQAQAESLLEHYVPLERTSSASSTSIATAIRGAWAIVAARYCGSNEAVFGETLTGRNAPIPGVEEIEGPMITTVPIRIRVNRQERVSDFLQDIHDQTVTRIAHEHMGLQYIRRLSPDTREACELRTGLVIHPTEDQEETRPDMKEAPANGFVPAGDSEAAREALKFNSYALMLVFTVDTNGFLIMASFDSKTVDKPQMQGVLEQLGQTVQFLCEKTTASVNEIEQFSDEDRLGQWRLSKAGLQNLRNAGTLEQHILEGATAAWIVHPEDKERLVLVGAVGELVLEYPSNKGTQSVGTPDWLIQGSGEFPGRESRIVETGYLAKYRSDGTLNLLGTKEETIRQSGLSNVQWGPAREDVQQTSSSKEKKLQELWSRVIGVNEAEIARNDSFFDLGGDSISAMKLVSEARTEGMVLTVAKIFRHRRLADMAGIMEDMPTEVSEEGSKQYTPFAALDVRNVDRLVADIQPTLAEPNWKITDIIPARPLQEIAVKGTVQLPRFSARYELFYLDGAIDRHRLLECCQDLVSRNEILRTVFVESGDDCFGVVLADIQVPIVEYEIDGDLETFSRTLCEVDVQEKMPLGSSFAKFMHVQGSDGRNCLVMRISHAQYDEICLPVLLRQLSALYEGTTLPESQPFSAYVGHLVQDNIPQSVQYWRELLRGSSMSAVRPTSPLLSKKPASVYRNVDISSRSRDITVATLPTAAWALCLARHLNIRDVTFGEVVSGRNTGYPNCETVMGPCWQYIPVRVKLASGWNGLDLLNSVQDQHIASARFEGIGFKEIVRDCTDWPETVDWFDSVVHQDVAHVNSLPFLSAHSRMETIYPHLEPLREWKIQAFFKGDQLCMEIVTFESWLDQATELLDGLQSAMRQLVNDPHSPIL